MNLYILLAEVVAVVHAAYVAFVVIGFALIIGGLGRQLVAIVFACIEAVMAVVCPLTTLESRLRVFENSLMTGQILFADAGFECQQRGERAW